jgi:L-threonylcarbamoyladenylate synthase
VQEEGVPLLPATPENVARAAECLKAGGIVAFPTESVYGLGAIVWDVRAVARVFEAKRRPSFDPLIVHVLDRQMLGEVVAEFPAAAAALAERFWPGPLTLVLPKRPAVPSLVTAGLETVAVRMPSHPVARSLIEAAGAPIAAPSANPFGALSSTRAEHVARTLGDAADIILDAGPAERGIESTIVALEPHPTLLRPGAIPLEEIQSVISVILSRAALAARVEGLSKDERPTAPGQLAQHYAPRTPLRVADLSGVPLAQRVRAGALALRQAPPGYAAVRVLSAAGDLREAAARLFDALHELDALGLEWIYAEPIEERGLGLAIADRLGRAQAAG